MAYRTPSVRDGSGRGSRATGQGRRGGKFTAGGGTASTAQELLGQFGSSSDGSGSDRDAGMNSDALRSGSDDVSSRGGSSSSDSYRGPFVGHRHGGHGSRSGSPAGSASGGERGSGSGSGCGRGSDSNGGRGGSDSDGPGSNGRDMQARLTAIDQRMVEFARNNRRDLELLTITRSAVAAVSLLCT
jgi:hypothetical protein